MIKIATKWNGATCEAWTVRPERIHKAGDSVAHAVSKVVKALAKKHKGKPWQDDNGTRGIVGQEKTKKAGKAKPSTLPQLEMEGGRMLSHRTMKEDGTE